MSIKLPASTKFATDGGPKFGSFCCVSRPGLSEGGVKVNQDSYTIVSPFAGRNDWGLFVVMDGHGVSGETLSAYCVSRLPVILEMHPKVVADPGTALRESFVAVDEELREMFPREAYKAGTTCVCALVAGGTIFVANSGDSRCVVGSMLANNTTAATELSRDHKPDDPAELARIHERGGWVSQRSEKCGPSRVFTNGVPPLCGGLAMARSLGDHMLGEVGVIAEPEVRVHEMGTSDKCLVLASDGLWDYVPPREVVEMVNAKCPTQGGPEEVEAAAIALMGKSSDEWAERFEGCYRDDITILIVALQPAALPAALPPAPRVVENGDKGAKRARVEVGALALPGVCVRVGISENTGMSERSTADRANVPGPGSPDRRSQLLCIGV